MCGHTLFEDREAFLRKIKGSTYQSHGLRLSQPLKSPSRHSTKVFIRHTVPRRYLTPPAITFNFRQPVIIEPILEDTVLKNKTHNN